MVDSLLSSQIYLSRDSIREMISDEIKTYLELENVDLTKSSFLSFMVDTFSTLTGNLLFYQLSAYREFFLTKAQLPESILNLSAFLGYNTKEASAASVNVLMTFPFGFDDPLVQFTIPSEFKFKADGEIEFVTYYTINITVTNNKTVNVQLIDSNNRRVNLPVNTTGSFFSFVLNLKQVTLIEQEFQVDGDTREFQFVTIDVPIEGQVSSMKVFIQEPGSSSLTLWKEYQSLYLMSDTDEGYVSRRTDTGRRITFGNGLIGVQPTPGSTVFITTSTTQGADGNVIAGSITTGERIYLTTGAGVREIVEYTVINTSPAFGGKDEESFEEIRRNSIDNITSLKRLVTENDYKVINVVVDVPFAQNSLPVLKRSDLQVNEISLFNGLVFGPYEEEVENLVPMRNTVITVPTGTTEIFRGTTVVIGGVNYLTLFDINISVLNSVGEYEYVMLKIEQTPNLETTFTSNNYDIFANLLTVEKKGNRGIFTLDYGSTESDDYLASCEMVIKSSGSLKNMTNDATSSVFIYEFDPYTDIPSGEQTYEFTIYDSGGLPVATYSNKITFRKDLSTFMRSNVVSDSTSIIVYDVPVIQEEYFNNPNFSQTDFENDVMQTIITTDLSDARMTTDFTNIKFTNTDGILTNMSLNEVTAFPVIDLVTNLPSVLNTKDRYIITKVGDTHQDNIVNVIDSTGPILVYEQPVGDAIVYVENKGEKYIYSERGWIPIPNYTIPLKLDIEVFRESTYSGTLSGLIDSVRQSVYNAFKGVFGTNAVIWRSEIIDVVQNVDGVRNCRLLEPETSIFYNFELKNLTEEQLLRYGPEYVFFRQEDITVRVI
jgi:hypothetical protein